MTNVQFWIVLVYELISLLVMMKGFFEVYKKDNAFGGGSVLLFLLGVFVWGGCCNHRCFLDFDNDYLSITE